MAKLNSQIIVFIAVISSIIISCEKNKKRNILETKPTSSTHSFQKDWARKNIPQKWIEIKKDEKGYLIYQPCEGNTVTIDFNANSGIEIINQLEIKKIEYDIRDEINSDAKFFINFSKNKKQVFEIEATEYDSKNQIALFKIENHYFLMTPFENKDSFRKIQNMCVKEKVDELEFLPIN
ncbi:hypothetical protein [Epilithonimonas lactis]|uniref:Lipoprotein n=1 Tax=Epilithonimonas lactis TaxID=421072 RepID=A0A085BIA9_9FLAO|nr:hypothetical protein [Epilithonimonas lactis]KFC22204.1 hypothetical protein IO89_09650 [Epilithonimonas lactis]SEQ57807.1 hypothetical protein SAMN04488097_2545 [Epilithonimonas lactis]